MLKRLRKDVRGQAMVEMAIVLPLLLLLMMIIFDFGRVFNSYLVISNASREGARMAIVNYNVQKIKDLAVDTASTLSGSVEPTVESSTTESGRKKVTVSVSYQVNLVAPLLSSIIPNPFTIKASTTTYI